MQREGLFREMKNRRAFEKPSERRARETGSTRRVQCASAWSVIYFNFVEMEQQ